VGLEATTNILKTVNIYYLLNASVYKIN